MKPQHRVTEPCDLLDENGHLTAPGYATQPYWRYNRKQIKASWHRIKEWDYYYILVPEKGYGITLTIADLGYIGLCAICWLDFQAQTFAQSDTLFLLPMGKTNLPATSESGVSEYKSAKLTLRFEVSAGTRVLSFEVPHFGKGKKALKGRLSLSEDLNADSMVIATSWEENRKAFYYNRKVNCMPAEGQVTMGDETYEFTPQTAFGGLDWGRGNWTYRNRWYWGSASGLFNGESLGWNLGYGFSDRSVATENMVFYKGQAHKLDEVLFHFDANNYLAPWQFRSNDGRFEMSFAPLLDRNAIVDFKLIKSIQHQVFGLFSGKVVLDHGEVLEIKDFLGFAEDVLNWW